MNFVYWLPEMYSRKCTMVFWRNELITTTTSCVRRHPFFNGGANAVCKNYILDTILVNGQMWITQRLIIIHLRVDYRNVRFVRRLVCGFMDLLMSVYDSRRLSRRECELVTFLGIVVEGKSVARYKGEGYRRKKFIGLGIKCICELCAIPFQH